MRFIAAAVTAFAAAAAFAADPAAVPRPQVKPGDSWTYQRMDYWTKKSVGEFREAVTFANDRVIVTVGQRDKQEKEVDATYTSDWNFVSSPRGRIFEPDQELFRFPLHVGDKYDVRFSMKDPTEGGFDMKNERHVKVVGWEDVTVPAGKFHALRIESEGQFERIDAPIVGMAKEIAWYAPEVKRFVKWTYENSTFKGRNQWFGQELLEYKVQ